MVSHDATNQIYGEILKMPEMDTFWLHKIKSKFVL